LTALNMRLRDDYTQTRQGHAAWNKIISTSGYHYKLTLPNVAFHRRSASSGTPMRRPTALIDDATWTSARANGCRRPTTAISSLADDAVTETARRALDLAAKSRHRQQARRF